jgi:glycosyltransferase involved in cell wall biosynthesis
MGKHKLHFHIFALSIWDKGYSGGDRIFVELSRRFAKKGHRLTIHTWERGKEITEREGLEGSERIEIVEYHLQKWLRLGFAFQYGARILQGFLVGLFLSQKYIQNSERTILYCSSDFWMDSIPCLLLKIRFPKTTWIGTYYLSAPNPFRGFKEGGGLRFPSLNNLLYWLQQKPMIYFMRKYADYIFVTSEPDARKFPEHHKKNTYVIVYGGVDLDIMRRLEKEMSKLPKLYDGVFMGRFHPQKGVLDLIEIWKYVVQKKKNAQLVMIGDGDLMESVKKKIRIYNLEQNILLKGYVLDGNEKYRIFNQCRIFLHPAIYDSGGMSAAEGMAWGLPAISFDLEALKTYYPKGMIKVPIGDKKKFAENILELLENKHKYEKTKRDAKALVEEEWDWNNRAEMILKKIAN